MANQDASSDTPVDLKKRARRRLVGAIALALLAVIVLPMVMDHEPKPASQDIQIRIPSQETESPAPHAATGQAAVPPAPSAAAPSTEATSVKTDEPPRPDSKTESKSLAPAATLPEQADKVGAAVASIAKPAEKIVSDKTASAQTAAEAHAAAVLNGGGDQWLVRLGAYQNAANVKLLLAKVKETGIPVYAEKFDSPKGPRTRVLAGPFNSRDAAEKAQAKIKKLGVDGAVAPKQ